MSRFGAQKYKKQNHNDSAFCIFVPPEKANCLAFVRDRIGVAKSYICNQNRLCDRSLLLKNFYYHVIHHVIIPDTKPQIAFILTGGSIDKEYGALDRAFTIGNGAVERVLKFVNPNFKADIISLFQKVSVDITEKDKNKIAKTCSKVTTNKIILTYGTDAMTDIGETLATIKDKTIVIVGSLKSQLIKDTDAEFNLGFAVAAVQTLPAGVYIAMSGRIYPWNKCKKNKTSGQFIEK